MNRPNVYMTAAELIKEGRCPFIDGRFQLRLDEPCPVCGMLGTDVYDDMCVGEGSK